MRHPSDILLGGTNLITFSSGTSAEEKSDILDCLAYSEIKANAKYSRKKSWAQWVDRFQLGFYKNGFEITDALPDERFTLTDPRDLSSVVEDAIATAENGELEQLARSAFNELLHSNDGKGFFRDWFSRERSENVQIIPCRKDAYGRVEILFCGLEMNIGTTESSWYQGSRSKISVTIAGGTYRYSAQAYAPHRKNVASFLDEHTYAAFQTI